MKLTKIPTDEALWKQWWEATKEKSVAGPFDIEFVGVDEESLELRMEISDAARQPFGLFHGGVSMLLAESAASMHSCWGTDLSEVAPVGIEINGSHLSSVREGHVRAIARVIRRGRKLVVHQVEIIHEESEKLLCRSRVTNLFVPHER